MTNKHIKICNSFVIRKLQVKSTLVYQYTLNKIALFEKTKKDRVFNVDSALPTGK